MYDRKTLLIIITASFIFMSCRGPENESEINSLENYTAADNAKIVKNSCQGPYVNKDYADLEHIDAPEYLQATIRETLSSIPLSIREIFSTKFIGKIRTAEDTTSLCSMALKNLSEERLKTGNLDTRSCLRAEPGVPGVELVIPASKESIRHGLVRAYFSAVFTTMAESKYEEELDLLVADRKSADLLQLEKMVQSALRTDLVSKKNINKNLFANPVDAVIEAADQYYCSKATRSKLRKEYKETYKKFKQYYVNIIHETGEKNPEEIYNEIPKVDAVASKNTLGLWGRWGFGNGPLRAWGRSRIAARQSGGRGLFPNWNLARQNGYASGGRGLFPNWQQSRQTARQRLQHAGYPGTSAFPGYWANRLT